MDKKHDELKDHLGNVRVEMLLSKMYDITKKLSSYK